MRHGWLLSEVTRAGKLLQIGTALGRAVPIQHGVGEVLHVERDAIATGDHEQDRPEQRERKPDWVAPEFHSLAMGIGPQPTYAETPPALGRWRWRRCRSRLQGSSTGALASALLRRRGLLQVGDEGFLQRLDTACPQRRGGGILGQHFAGV